MKLPFSKYLGVTDEDRQKVDLVFDYLNENFDTSKDPWGMDFDVMKKTILTMLPVYRNYFKVRFFEHSKIPKGPFIAVANHTGQIPIDGMLVSMAFALELDQPILLRGMVERFLAKLPFLGAFTAKTGSILGDRKNCEFLLKNNNSILVFPEGVRGVSKPTSKYYELQKFTYGFYRIALEHKIPILPIAVVGAEEMFPYVAHSKKLSKVLGVPAIPLSLNYFPLPSPIDIHVGEIIEPNCDLKSTHPDSSLETEINKIEQAIDKMVQDGRKNKRNILRGQDGD